MVITLFALITRIQSRIKRTMSNTTYRPQRQYSIQTSIFASAFSLVFILFQNNNLALAQMLPNNFNGQQPEIADDIPPLQKFPKEKLNKHNNRIKNNRYSEFQVS